MYKHFTYRLVKNIRTSGKTSHRASKKAKMKIKGDAFVHPFIINFSCGSSFYFKYTYLAK